MNLFERPPERSARWWAFDIVVAVAVAANSVPEWIRADVHPRLLVAVVAVALTAPLAVRRLRPLEVFAWVFVLSAVGAAFNVHLASGLATVVALYTVASLRSRREAVAAATALEVGVLVIAVVLEGDDFVGLAVLLTGMVAAALGLGLYSGTRRAYLSELQSHAARLERERDQDRELAVISERSRIAREMHDIVAHHLTVMVALSDGAAAASANTPERAAEVMRTVSDTGRQALADTRRLLGVLGSDGELNRQPVPDLTELEALVATVRAAGVPVSYEVQGAAPQLASGVQLTVYRLVQEALTNTMKHGGAGARATVRLRYLPDELQLSVTDDGAGVAAVVRTGAGRGLTGMQERVHAFGGHVESGPLTPSGWRVTASLRLDDVAAPAAFDPVTHGVRP